MAGSLEKRGKDSWRLVVSCGIDAKGQQIKVTKTVKTSSKRHAEKLLAEFVTAVEKGQFIATDLTLKDFVERWLKEYGENHLAPKTLARYKDILNNRIIPALGHLRIDKIRPVHLMSFYNNLAEPGLRLDGKKGALSARTIQMHHRVLSAVLQDAVEWQIITDNPCNRVAAPKIKKTVIQILNEEQMEVLLAGLDQVPLKWKVLCLLALSAGLRLGELLGLEWKHIDFDKQTVSIEQSSQYINGIGVFIKGTKNSSSERLIALPSSVVELLRSYKECQSADQEKLADLWHTTDRLFTQWNGKPMHPSSFNHWLKQYCADHDLPRISPHAFRHMSATMLLNAGISLKNVSGRLGHSKTSTTGDIYSHFLKSVDKLAAETMDKILESKPKEPKK